MRILFVCTGNACRSQMAEGFARALLGPAVTAFSAGLTPKGLDPRAVTVMAEAGVDIAGQRSKSITALPDVPFDVVVTLCGEGGETCPYVPGAGRRIHAGFDDPPALAAKAAFRGGGLGTLPPGARRHPGFRPGAARTVARHPARRQMICFFCPKGVCIER